MAEDSGFSPARGKETSDHGNPYKPRVAILGVTGFIGRGLPALLAESGMVCTGISRSGASSVPGVVCWQTPETMDFSGHQAVINLAGEPINQRWTKENRVRFHDSRVGMTRRVVDAIRILPIGSRPEVLVNVSAVGIFGDRGDEVLTETSAPGRGYLADLCCDWEAAAMEAETLGVRVVRPRLGVVLGREGPAFRKLLRLFKCGLGGRLGNGLQWMSWIHLEDLRTVLVRSVSSNSLSGALNCTAPAAERNRDFTRKLAAALHRPALCPVPGFALKLALGGFGGALLESQHARPAALEEDSFSFRFPTMKTALKDLIQEA